MRVRRHRNRWFEVSGAEAFDAVIAAAEVEEEA